MKKMEKGFGIFFGLVSNLPFFRAIAQNPKSGWMPSEFKAFGTLWAFDGKILELVVESNFSLWITLLSMPSYNSDFFQKSAQKAISSADITLLVFRTFNSFII